MAVLKLGVWYGVRLVVGLIGAAFYATLSHADKVPLWQAAALVIVTGVPTILSISLADIFEDRLTRNWSPPWEIAAAKVRSGRGLVEFLVSATFMVPVAAALVWLGYALPQRQIIFETGTAWFMGTWALWSVGSCVKFKDTADAIRSYRWRA